MILPAKLAIVAILIFLALFFSPSSLKVAFSYAPFLPTPKKAVRKALRETGLEVGETFYDLGSGTGKVVIMADKEFGALARGYEYSTPLFIYSKINLFVHRAKKARVFKHDFLKADLSKADVIFAFLTPKAFAKLEKKFNQEIRPRSRVVTFSSPLLFWQPDKIIDLPNDKIKIYLYIRK